MRAHFESAAEPEDASMRAEDLVTSDGVAESGSEKNVRGEVGAGGDAGKADGCGEAVSEPGSPAMALISGGNYGGDGEDSGGVSRGEAAAFEG